jgi:hypothetical protein
MTFNGQSNTVRQINFYILSIPPKYAVENVVGYIKG